MFPLYDSTPRRSFPFINYLLIAINVYVFFVQLSSPDPDAFIFQNGFIPSRFSLSDLSTYEYILRSMFLHGGFLHILSNMWFLHIFGDNVEDVMGHLPYLIFYLVGGIVATFAQYIIAPGLTVPLIGASGAISAVAGAYYVLFRHSRVVSIVAIFIFWQIVRLPVWIFLGYWFILTYYTIISLHNTI